MLSKAEARELFETYVEGVEARAAALPDRLRVLGGRPEWVDGTPESLVPIWTWMMATQRLRAEPASVEEMAAADPPWWYPFWMEDGSELGPALARLVESLAAYMAQMVIRDQPGTIWMYETRKGDTFPQMPQLAIGGTAKHWGVDLTVMSITRRELGPNARSNSPRALLDLYELYFTLPPPPEPPRTDAEMITIDASDQPSDFSHEIMIDEEARGGSRRVARFIRLLASVSGIREVVHEDRELILLDAPGVDPQVLAGAIRKAWEAAKAP